MESVVIMNDVQLQRICEWFSMVGAIRIYYNFERIVDRFSRIWILSVFWIDRVFSILFVEFWTIWNVWIKNSCHARLLSIHTILTKALGFLKRLRSGLQLNARCSQHFVYFIYLAMYSPVYTQHTYTHSFGCFAFFIFSVSIWMAFYINTLTSSSYGCYCIDGCNQTCIRIGFAGNLERKQNSTVFFSPLASYLPMHRTSELTYI